MREAGIPVVLRIDPLFPRSPLPCQPSNLRDFGLLEAQTSDDLEHLVAFAREVGVRHVVDSAAKIVRPWGRALSPTRAAMREVYRALCSPGKPVKKPSWRLPRRSSSRTSFSQFVKSVVAAKFCMRDLLEIP